MWNIALATGSVRDLLRPRRSGEPVNVHVVESVREPAPDFDAMQRTIEQRVRYPSPNPTRTVTPRIEHFPRTADLPSQSPLFLG